MFGGSPSTPPFPELTASDVTTHHDTLWSKLAELRDFVEYNLTAAIARQKLHYDANTTTKDFREGDQVWLSRPTAGKLDPHWEGGWKVRAIKGPLTVEISNGPRIKRVHENGLHQRLQLDMEEQTVPNKTTTPPWQAPTIDH